MGIIVTVDKELDNGITLSNVYMNVNEIHVVKHALVANVNGNSGNDPHYEIRTKFASYTSREAAINGKAYLELEDALTTRDTLDPNETVFTQAYIQIKQNYEGVYQVEDVFEN
tara:strand:- start:60 stop:398 length:339 start_codon:yes stop_codon:yes gene_type:complete